MAGKLFKGKDRRMIQKCKNVLAAIQERDIKALDFTKKTQALSTRTVILDTTDFDTAAALGKIMDVLTAKLAAMSP